MDTPRTVEPPPAICGLECTHDIKCYRPVGHFGAHDWPCCRPITEGDSAITICEPVIGIGEPSDIVATCDSCRGFQPNDQVWRRFLWHHRSCWACGWTPAPYCCIQCRQVFCGWHAGICFWCDEYVCMDHMPPRLHNCRCLPRDPPQTLGETEQGAWSSDSEGVLEDEWV